MANITIQQLQECRAHLDQGIKALHDAKGQAFQDGVIDQQTFLKLQAVELRLQSEEGALLLAIMNTQLNQLSTDVPDSPKDRIIAATDKLQTANNQLKNLNSFLGFLGNLIDLFGAIATAVQTPNLATINGIINKINTFS